MIKRAACILYQRHDGKILVVNRFNKSGIEKDYGLPGGKLEPGESPLDAAIRETFEETGIVVDAFFGKPYEAVDACDGYHTSTYHALTLSNDIIKSSDEGEALWVDPIELLGHQCTFREYNANVLDFFKIVEDPWDMNCPQPNSGGHHRPSLRDPVTKRRHCLDCNYFLWVSCATS